ncbi:MAG TPA: nickel pincer cofactor biosynthesis protein LarB [Blastocatellia bacterium]|nr:nickel pincer cofactor biosynthesis protein LarB [Blastocatellia bacterium]
MTRDRIKNLLEQVRSGHIDVDRAADRLARLPYEDIEIARVDHHREMRVGFPEVVLGQGKSAGQILRIAERILANGSNLLISRTTEDVFERVSQIAPDAEFHDLARMITVLRDRTERGEGTIAVISAGTSDIPVAEEAAITAMAMGNRVTRIYDVGVAGIHRLFGARRDYETARVIIVVAGMEGALPSVVGGLVAVPVIAVPTSIGYGASFGGLAALLGMLNSCASNVTVVNIDNGFGAGFVASLINRKSRESGESRESRESL